MKFIQSPRFRKAYKKLHVTQQREINKAIHAVIGKPLIGQQKKGDLVDIYVYKFKVNRQEILIAYKFISADEIEFIGFGPHENFYRDLSH